MTTVIKMKIETEYKKIWNQIIIQRYCATGKFFEFSKFVIQFRDNKIL